MANVAAAMGTPLMPWQRLVADVGGEWMIDPETGRMVPAYREIIVTVMRQNGKSTLVLSVQVERCLMWGQSQRVAYTAQTGLDGRQKFVQDQMPVLRVSPLDVAVERYYMAADNTGAVFTNGSRISVLSVGQESGHGKTLDLAIIDEAFADSDDRREQALLPTMTTRPAAQIWNTSTAGTPASTYLLRKVQVGRAMAEAGRTEGIAYFEWSIPESEDIDDPDVWWRYMPALGYTIQESTIRHARESMPDGEFRRAYGNQWTDTEERVIPGMWWVRAQSETATVNRDTCTLAIDARQDRSYACIVAADPSGVVELVAARQDVSWLVEWFNEDDSRRRRPIVVDAGGPLAGVGDLLARNCQIVRVNSAEMKKASADLFDRFADNRLTVRTDPRLDWAVRAATKRVIGDGFIWHRDAVGGDILNAASTAVWQAAQPAADTTPTVMFV